MGSRWVGKRVGAELADIGNSMDLPAASRYVTSTIKVAFSRKRSSFGVPHFRFPVVHAVQVYR